MLFTYLFIIAKKILNPFVIKGTFFAYKLPFMLFKNVGKNKRNYFLFRTGDVFFAISGVRL